MIQPQPEVKFVAATTESLEAMTPQEHLRRVAFLEANAKNIGGGHGLIRDRRDEAQIHIGMALIKLGIKALGANVVE